MGYLSIRTSFTYSNSGNVLLQAGLGKFLPQQMHSTSGPSDSPSYAGYMIMDKLLLSSVDIFSLFYAEL